MPPEVLELNPKYNAAIDMFSFGHLALYTLVQDFPYPTAFNTIDPNNPGMLVARTEVQRRSEQMEQLSRQLGGGRHPLVQLVTQCLHNDPRQRPSARQVLSQLEGMRAQIEDPYQDMSKLELIQALRGRVGGGGGAALETQVAQLEVFTLLYNDIKGWSYHFSLQTLQGQVQAREAQVTQLEVFMTGVCVITSEECHVHVYSLPCLQGQLQVQAVELEASQAETQRVQVSDRDFTTLLSDVWTFPHSVSFRHREWSWRPVRLRPNRFK